MSTEIGPSAGLSRLNSAQQIEVRSQLERLASTPEFAASLRRGQLLRYLVERGLDAKPEAINEYAIGLDVFEKPASFDPRIESIVRTEVGRLRQKLAAYYAAEGQADRVVIEIPPRSYAAMVTFRGLEREEPQPAGVVRGASKWRRVFLAGALAVLAGAAVTAGIWRVRSQNAIRSLVVLPFQNLSPAGEDQYLADGLTEELTNEFANSKGLRVVARTSAYAYKGRGKDIREIGQELNVDAVLEGSLTKQGNHIRITAQLNRTADGYHLWSQSFDTWSLDMLTVQREMAQAIAASVSSSGGKGPSIPPPSASNPEALDLYLRASYEYEKLTQSSLERSLELFRQAIAKDPEYARAYVGEAMAELELTNFASSPDAVEEARASAVQALKLDPKSGGAHWLLAEIAQQYDGDWPRAQREYQLAFEQGDQPAAHATYGWSLAGRGRFSEAQTQCTIAQNQEPLGIAPRFCQYYVYYFQHDFARAQSVLAGALDMHPDLLYAHEALGRIAILQKNCAEAVKQFDLSLAKKPPPFPALASAYECACRGENRRARGYLEQAALAPGLPMFQLAIAYALAGYREQAMSYLQKSASRREGLPNALHDPALDSVRSDPRFVALEKAAGLDVIETGVQR